MTFAALARADIALQVDLRDPDALIERAKMMLELDMPLELALTAMALARCAHPEAPHWHDHILARFYNRAIKPENVNIGGGANWQIMGWVNFDSASSPLHPVALEFSPQVDFPYPSGKARLVYSSHCFEHLNDATVDRVLSEARRMLRPDGALVLKLPDFDEVLVRWRAGDNEYFRQWGMDKVVPTWKNRGVEDTIDARAAMIFCGWWNDAYGDEFGGNRHPEAEGAYHGPALVPRNNHRAYLSYGDCHRAAWEYRQDVPEGAHFNHRNAWSLKELIELLCLRGFRVLSTDGPEICQRLPQIPGIADQANISMYLLAAPS